MNLKKRLLIFHPAIGSYRVDLFNALSETFETALHIEYFKPLTAIYDNIRAVDLLKIKPVQLPKYFKIGSQQIFKGYWTALKRHNPDLVLVSEYGFDAIASISFKKLYHKKYRIISLCDDSYHMLSSDFDFSRFHKIARRLIAPHLDNIVLVEPAARDWYLQHYNKGIYFPIVSDEKRIRTEYEKALPLSRQYMGAYDLEGKMVFLYVGRLVEIKNVYTLIKAFKKAAIKNAKLIIVGEGNQEGYLKMISAGNPNIHFTGRLTGDKLNAWYNIADTLVLPSKVEPFGAVTNEALVGGCSVIISKNAGSKCLVEDGGNGYVFDPSDEDSLTEIINSLHSFHSQKPEIDLSVVRNSKMQLTFHHYYSNLIKDIDSL